MRSLLKSTIECIAARSGPSWIARQLRRTSAVILAYHNVVPEGEAPGGERTLHVLQRSFARQMDLLSQTHDVVPVVDILRPGPGTRPRAAITFDDAYRGAVTVGVAEVVRRGLPATVFVAPAFIGDGTFWWDALADPVTGELVPALREFALSTLAGRDSEIRAWAAAEGRGLITPPEHARAGSEAELARAAEYPGITVASHTWSHPNLARLEPRDVESELRRSAAWLKERFPGALPWLAYPYGLATPAVHEAARITGHHAALLVSGGWLGSDWRSARFALPRLNIPAGLSDAGFVLRAAGLVA